MLFATCARVYHLVGVIIRAEMFSRLEINLHAIIKDLLWVLSLSFSRYECPPIYYRLQSILYLSVVAPAAATSVCMALNYIR